MQGEGLLYTRMKNNIFVTVLIICGENLFENPLLRLTLKLKLLFKLKYCNFYYHSCRVIVFYAQVGSPTMRQVHVADGIQFVRDITNSVTADEVPALHGNVNTSDNTIHSIKGICSASSTEVGGSSRIDVLIIDVDSSNSR